MNINNTTETNKYIPSGGTTGIYFSPNPWATVDTVHASIFDTRFVSLRGKKVENGSDVKLYLEFGGLTAQDTIDLRGLKDKTGNTDSPLKKSGTLLSVPSASKNDNVCPSPSTASIAAIPVSKSSSE